MRSKMNYFGSLALVALAAIGVLLTHSTPAEANILEALKPFEAEISYSFGPGSVATGSFLVPQGQRLVIEQITGQVRLLNTTVDQVDAIVLQNWVDWDNDGFSSDEVHFHQLNVSPPRQIGNDLVYTVSQRVLFYSDRAITFPSLMVWNALAGPVWSTQNGQARFTVSGNLVRLP